VEDEDVKRPIRWHEDCLKNQYAHALRKESEAFRARAEALRKRAEADELLNDAHAYARQIAKAKAMKKDGFDREKFAKQ
jgi:hypothetical protein